MVHAHDDKKQKIDPYWMQGKWYGEGTGKDGSKFKEVSTFKVISTEPEHVMQYQQMLQDAKDEKKMSAESGFWRIFPEHDHMRKLESSFLHPWGL